MWSMRIGACKNWSKGKTIWARKTRGGFKNWLYGQTGKRPHGRCRLRRCWRARLLKAQPAEHWSSGILRKCQSVQDRLGTASSMMKAADESVQVEDKKIADLEDQESEIQERARSLETANEKKRTRCRSSSSWSGKTNTKTNWKGNRAGQRKEEKNVGSAPCGSHDRPKGWTAEGPHPHQVDKEQKRAN